MNIYLVILIIVAIVVFSNLFMFAMVRGSRGRNFDFFRAAKNDINKPFKAEEEQLNELRQFVAGYREERPLAEGQEKRGD